MLMNFAGLYEFDAITRPFAFVDKIVIVFATTFCFSTGGSIRAENVYRVFAYLDWQFRIIILHCHDYYFGLLLRRLSVGLRIGRYSRATSSSWVPATKWGSCWTNIDKSQPRFITVLGVFVESRRGYVANDVSRYATLGTVDDLPSYIRSNNVDDVIICLPWSADGQITAMMDKLRELPVNVYLGADLIGFRLPIRPAPDHFEELPLVEVMGRPLAGWGGIQKAALDYGLGIILTILLLPMMILIVIAIRLESKGPALFRQQRYGFINRTFEIYKFRTMRHTRGAGEENRAGDTRRSEGNPHRAHLAAAKPR